MIESDLKLLKISHQKIIDLLNLFKKSRENKYNLKELKEEIKSITDYREIYYSSLI